MASKIYTTSKEEYLIDNIRKNGLELSNLPKYIILRLAINISFTLSYKALNDIFYQEHVLNFEEQKKGSEYNLEQVTGKGTKGAENYDELLRIMFFVRHKDEKLDFSDDDIFCNTLKKYINRGLYELDKIYKNQDDFYQLLIDTFKLNQLQNMKDEAYDIEYTKPDLSSYLKQLDIDFDIINQSEALHEDLYKIRLKTQDDIKRLEKNLDTFSSQFGLHGEAHMQRILGESMCYCVALPREAKLWRKFGKDEFLYDIKNATIKDQKIIAYAGRDLNEKSVFFDIAQTPHLFVAGTTGSGKSTFLHSLILSIHKLQPKVKLILIDPKNGEEFGVYENIDKIRVLKDVSKSKEVLGDIVEMMEQRTAGKQEKTPLVVVVDEVADLLLKDKSLQEKIVSLAQKARSANIHLILATQTPNSEIFSQTLRANIPSRVALKVVNSRASLIVIDEVGAENLLGSGELYIKLKTGEKQKLISPFLSQEDIRELLHIL